MLHALRSLKCTIQSYADSKLYCSVVVEKSNGEDDDAVRDWWPWIDGRGKCAKRTMIGDDGEERTVRDRSQIIPKAICNKDKDKDKEEMGDVVPLEIGGSRLQ